MLQKAYSPSLIDAYPNRLVPQTSRLWRVFFVLTLPRALQTLATSVAAEQEIGTVRRTAILYAGGYIEEVGNYLNT